MTMPQIIKSMIGYKRKNKKPLLGVLVAFK